MARHRSDQHEFQDQGPREYTRGDIQRPPVDAHIKAVKRGTPTGGYSLYQLELLHAIRRQSVFIPITQVITVDPVLVLPASERTYFIVQNNSAAATLFVGTGFQPNSTFGIALIPGGFYEPFQVPQNDIWLASSANCQITILYAGGEHLSSNQGPAL